MSNFTKFSIVASFVGLWFTSFFNEYIQIVVGFVLIFTFGILHGANDLQLIEKSHDKKDAFRFNKILVFYSLTVVLGALLFYFLPIFALIVFVFVSSYHFGEQHWIARSENLASILNNIFYLSYGFLILSTLFVLNKVEVQKVVEEIVKIEIPVFFLEVLFYSSSISFLILVIFRIFQSEQFKRIIVRELFLLFVLALLFKVSSLIWGFTIYFIFWHSIPSIKDQMFYLYGNVSKESFIKYFKSALLYWISALLGIFVLYFALKESHIFDALFFSFLAAITFPHVWVMVRMFLRNKY